MNSDCDDCADLDAELDSAVNENERMADLLDRFTETAEILLNTDFGERARDNNPWTNALEALQGATAAPTVRLAADVVALAEQAGALHILLIERGKAPYEGLLALPGGHVDHDEEFEDAARRELREETGVEVAQLNEIGVYSAPDRDPRGRYVSTAYLARLDRMPDPTAGDDARTARWLPVAQILAQPERIAFDHAEIIHAALTLTDHRDSRTISTVVSGNAHVEEVVGLRFDQR